MARSSIEDVVVLVRRIEQQRGKAIKNTLSKLERLSGGELDKAVRKTILDEYNNLTRAIYAMLGYELET